VRVLILPVTGTHHCATHLSYYDNMSAKQCHGKHLPCSVNDTTLCVTQDEVRPSFALVLTKESRRIIGRYGLPAWELGVFLPVP